MRKKTIIYVPGLNDLAILNQTLISYLPRIWDQQEYDIHVIYPHWKEGISCKPKVQKIISKIDQLSKKRNYICLIGQSAGAGAVLNAYVERKEKVVKVVNICGRLRKGKSPISTLDWSSKGNPSFKDSVLLFENENEKKLFEKDRKKILTIRPIFDEIVPVSTVPLIGATNIILPMIGHSITGILALTLFSKRIREFLKTKN